MSDVLLDDLPEIERDLAALIQDEGLTESRLDRFGPTIVKLYGAQTTAFIIDRLRHTFELMPASKYRDALGYALDIYDGSCGNSLTDRRESFRQREIEVSDDTLRRWERRAIRSFARGIIVDVNMLNRERRRAQDAQIYPKVTPMTEPDVDTEISEIKETISQVMERLNNLEKIRRDR